MLMHAYVDGDSIGNVQFFLQGGGFDHQAPPKIGARAPHLKNHPMPTIVGWLIFYVSCRKIYFHAWRMHFIMLMAIRCIVQVFCKSVRRAVTKIAADLCAPSK